MACGWVTVLLSAATGADALSSLIAAGGVLVFVSVVGVEPVSVLVPVLVSSLAVVVVGALVVVSVVVSVVDDGFAAIVPPAIPGSLFRGNLGNTSHIQAITCTPGADNCWLAEVIGALPDILKHPNPNDDDAICISAADHCAEIFKSFTTIMALGMQRNSPWLSTEFSPVE